MKLWLLPLTCLLLPLPTTLWAASTCSVAPVAAQKPGPWLDQDNWLQPENLRLTLAAANQFMPMVQIKGPSTPEELRPTPRQLDLDKIKLTDPLDQKLHSLDFLLNTRLYADGILVMRNGRIWSERYWNGQSPQQPRLLLGATRPLLSIMGAMAVNQGKLAQDKSINRYIPALNAQSGLRKLSIKRLLGGNGQFNWTPQEITDWQMASGWKSNKPGGVRNWLNQPDRWEREFSDEFGPVSSMVPDDDLLVWALADSYRMPLAQHFCENMLNKLRPEHAVWWATDPQGTELSSGLALSLRDFARIGQMLIQARNSGNRSKIPHWFIETLTASSGLRKPNHPTLLGLQKGSEPRYGFIHLGGKLNRIAILGAHGTSLYIDFDQRLVIALYASHPKQQSPAMLATLEQIWEELTVYTQAKR